MAKETIPCVSCERPITPGRAKGAQKKWHKDGILPYCVACQQKRYADFLKCCDGNVLMGIWLACVCYDAPYYPEKAKEAAGKHPTRQWSEYLDILRENELNKENDEFVGFNPYKATLMDALVSADVLTDDGSEESTLVQTDAVAAESVPEQNIRWGVKFTAEGHASEYDLFEVQELNDMYREQAAEYKGALSPRIDSAIREICACKLEWKKCLGAGDSTGAKRFADMIKDIMAREGMKAGDVKPLEALRIDAITDRLEKNGCMRNGKLIGRDELVTVLSQARGKYSTSLDVVDEMMMAIINTSRRNNGESELTELPIEAQIEDRFGELLAAPSRRELQSMRELGVIPPKREEKPAPQTDGE